MTFAAPAADHVRAHDGELMPEILTESFCERCGTRYTFEAAAPARSRFGRLRVVSRGLKNYVLSDESSLEEAFAEARSDDERALTSQQLDAFHQTFNFCMSCRQYTCANCWNAVEGRCLTCAPHLGHEVLPAPFPTLDPRADVAAAAGPAPHGGNGRVPDEAVWPAADLGVSQAVDGRVAEPVVEPVVGPVVEPASIQAPDGSTDDRAAGAAAETAAFLSRFRPGQSLDSALEEYEEQAAETATAPQVGATAAPAPETRAEAAEAAAIVTAEAAEVPEAEPSEPAMLQVEVATAATDTGESMPEPPPAESMAIEEVEEAVGVAEAAAVQADAVDAIEAPMASQAEPEAAVAAAAVAAAAVGAADEEQASTPDRPEPAEPAEPARPARLAAAAAAWQVVAPDDEAQPGPPAATPAPAGAPTPAWPPLPPGTEAPQWPTTPAWPTEPTWPAATQPARGSDLLWAESSRDVLSAPATGQRTGSAVQPCVSCGLALSSTARFCRRCGSPQG